MRAALCLLLLAPALALGQGRTSSGGSCLMGPARYDIAGSYRATNLVGPAFEVDAVNICAVHFGPSADACLGTRVKNGADELVLGRLVGDEAAGTLRAGKVYAAQGVEIGNGYPVSIQNTAYITNAFGAVRVTNGLLVTGNATLPTCGSAGYPEGSHWTVPATATDDTKPCVCSRAAGPGAYSWRNLLNPSDKTGTTTTCPVSL